MGNQRGRFGCCWLVVGGELHAIYLTLSTSPAIPVLGRVVVHRETSLTNMVRGTVLKQKQGRLCVGQPPRIKRENAASATMAQYLPTHQSGHLYLTIPIHLRSHHCSCPCSCISPQRCRALVIILIDVKEGAFQIPEAQGLGKRTESL